MAMQLSTYSDAAADLNVRPTKLFIGGISRRTTTKQLRDHFAKFGRVLDCVAMRQPDGRPRGFGYVTLDSPEAAEQFLLVPQMIDERIVDVKPAVPDTGEKATTDGIMGLAPEAQQLLEPCQLRMMWPGAMDGVEELGSNIPGASFGAGGGFADQFGFPHTLLPGLRIPHHFADPSCWTQHTGGWPWYDAEAPQSAAARAHAAAGAAVAHQAATAQAMAHALAMSSSHSVTGATVTSTVPPPASMKSAGMPLMSTSPAAPAPCLNAPPGLHAAAGGGTALTSKQMQPAKIQTTQKPPAPLPAGLVLSQKSPKDVDSEAAPGGKAGAAMLLSLPTPSRRRSSECTTASGGVVAATESAAGPMKKDAVVLRADEGGDLLDADKKDVSGAEITAECKSEGISGAGESTISSQENSATTTAAEGLDEEAEKCKSYSAPPGLQLPPPGLWHGFSTDPPDAAGSIDAATAGSHGAAAAAAMPFMLLSTSPPTSAATKGSAPTPEPLLAPSSQPAPHVRGMTRAMGTQTEEATETCSRCGYLEHTARIEAARKKNA